MGSVDGGVDGYHYVVLLSCTPKCLTVAQPRRKDAFQEMLLVLQYILC